MALHEHKLCPRCNDTFECKCGSIQLCQCHNVALEDFHQDYIRSLYDDCLCASCLTELRRKYNLELLGQQMPAFH
jgi:hypothetical protein